MKIERTYMLRSGLAQGLKKRGGLGLRQRIRRPAPLDPEDAFLRSLDYTAKTVFDIGGFQGIHTIFFASRAGPEGRVVTFEPDPVNYDYIRRNVRLNGLRNVSLLNMGVSDRPGELEFAYPDDRGRGSAHPDHLKSHQDDSHVARVTLPVTSIDAKVHSGEFPAPDFVKIDVEGLELAVLEGMSQTVAERKPAIFVEIHGWGRAAKEANGRRVVAWLHAQGYEVHHLQSDQRITPENSERAAEGHLYAPGDGIQPTTADEAAPTPATVTAASPSTERLEPGRAVVGRRVAPLDAIRGIAIALVMLRHAFPARFGAGGFVGVELFFVLSGFLITGILRNDIVEGGIRRWSFYRNRLLRLLPALVVLLAVAALVVETTNRPVEDRTLGDGIFTAASYTSDLPHWPIPQLGDLTHLWTLAIEEQFYLLWPLVLVALAGRSTRRGAAACLPLGGAAVVLTVAYGVQSNDVSQIYTWPTIWAVTLLLGCALSVGVARPRVSGIVSTLAIAALCAVTLLPEAKGQVWGYLVVLPAAAVLGALVISNAMSERPSWILRSRALQYLGTISYGAYLWNYPLSRWLEPKLAIPVTVVVATLSYKLVERPFLRLKRHSSEPVVARQAVTG
jgi:FkbM family methyltransferase